MPDPSILRFDVILQDKSNIVDRRKQSAVTFYRNEQLETGFDIPLDGCVDPQSNKYPLLTFRVI